jgi:hypothetical protein
VIGRLRTKHSKLSKLGSESIFREHVLIRLCKAEEDFLSPHSQGKERKIGGIRPIAYSEVARWKGFELSCFAPERPHHRVGGALADSQAPPPVPHSVSCAASPANQTQSFTESISTRRDGYLPGAAAEKAPSAQGSSFQRVARRRRKKTRL